MMVSNRNTFLKLVLMMYVAIYSLSAFANSTPRPPSVANAICETCVQESQSKMVQALQAAGKEICEAMSNPEERNRCLNRDTSNTREQVVFLVRDENDKLVDPRVRMNDPQLNAIGLVEVSGVLKEVPKGFERVADRIRKGEPVSNKGTGFMINSCLMVTNHHVVFMVSTEDNISSGHTIQFTAGAATLGMPDHLRRKGAVIAHGGYNPSELNSFRDWAIVKLETPYGHEVQPLRTNYKQNLVEAEDENKLQIAALYPDTEGGRTLFGQSGCYGNADETSLRFGRAHYCSNMSGTSGAPILVNGEVIGINTTQRTPGVREHTGSEQGNGYIDLQTAIPKERLDQIIAANPCP